MHLIEIFLPLNDNDGRPFEPALFKAEQARLAERFGGLTAFTRAPAQGLWRDGGERVRDDIIVLEVMTGHLDTAWWRDYRIHLETTFRQERILIRASAVTVL